MHFSNLIHTNQHCLWYENTTCYDPKKYNEMNDMMLYNLYAWDVENGMTEQKKTHTNTKQNCHTGRKIIILISTIG